MVELAKVIWVTFFSCNKMHAEVKTLLHINARVVFLTLTDKHFSVQYFLLFD